MNEQYGRVYHRQEYCGKTNKKEGKREKEKISLFFLIPLIALQDKEYVSLHQEELKGER